MTLVVPPRQRNLPSKVSSSMGGPSFSATARVSPSGVRWNSNLIVAASQSELFWSSSLTHAAR